MRKREKGHQQLVQVRVAPTDFALHAVKKYVSLCHWIYSTLEAIRENVNTYATISAIH